MIRGLKVGVILNTQWPEIAGDIWDVCVGAVVCVHEIALKQMKNSCYI